MIPIGSRRLGGRLRQCLAAFLFAVVLLAATHAWWLEALGSFLIQAQAPEKADIVIVLAGDFYGHRVLKGGELVRNGFAPRALVNGPGNLYGTTEDKLAIPFAVRHGYPESYFEGFPISANSTRDEAERLGPEVRRRGFRKVLLVTSDYHSRRAGRMFRAALPDLEIVMVAAPDQWFRAGDWWKRREAQKIFLLEWTKTVASYFGI